MAELGPGWFFQLATQASHDNLRLLIELAQLAGVALSVLGVTLGGGALWWSEREDTPSRVARWAFYLGLLGLAAVVIAVLALKYLVFTW